MLIEFDQTTMANMTAALEHCCNQLPADRDSHETRKRIGDGIVACAKAGRRTLEDFQEADLAVLAEITQPARFSWFGLKRRSRTETE
jgi:hypothetical protein